MTTVPTVETDVLIVGSGPAGASAALALSTYGVPNVMVTRYSRSRTRPGRTSPTGAPWKCCVTWVSKRR